MEIWKIFSKFVEAFEFAKFFELTKENINEESADNAVTDYSSYTVYIAEYSDRNVQDC